MQDLNAPPRTNLDPAKVSHLLQGARAVKIEYGADHMAADPDTGLQMVGDLTSEMSDGSTVSSDITATVARSCSLLFDSDVTVNFNYLSDFVRPYMVQTDMDTGFSARFNLGVYVLSTPTYDNSVFPSVLTFTGYDFVSLLQTPIGDSWEVAVNTDPAQAVVDVIEACLPWAQVNMQNSPYLTTLALSWPFDEQDQYTYLDVANALLAQIGYMPLWVDWEGVFQVGPMPDLTTGEYEWNINLTDTDNIMAEARTSTQDLFDVPNRWIFVMSNLQTPPVEGQTQLTYDDTSNNPTSQTQRGRVQTKIYSVTTPTADATSYPALVDAAMLQIQADLNPAESFSGTISPFPLMWHWDQVLYTDPNIANISPQLRDARLALVEQWSLGLDGTSDMSVILQTIAVNTAADTANSEIGAT